MSLVGKSRVQVLLAQRAGGLEMCFSACDLYCQYVNFIWL